MPAPPSAAVHDAPVPARGRQIVFWAPKGGSGATTIAVNVAAAACEHGLRVAYTDLDPTWGDGITFFGDPAAPAAGAASPSVLHHPCGLRCYGASDAESSDALRTGLRSGHDLVVADSASGAPPVGERDLLLLVVALDLLSLRRARHALVEGMAEPGPVELICVSRAGSAVEVGDCEAVLGLESLAAFCHEPALVAAGDRGVFSYGLRRSKWGAELRRLTAVLCAGLEVQRSSA